MHSDKIGFCQLDYDQAIEIIDAQAGMIFFDENVTQIVKAQLVE